MSVSRSHGVIAASRYGIEWSRRDEWDRSRSLSGGESVGSRLLRSRGVVRSVRFLTWCRLGSREDWFMIGMGG